MAKEREADRGAHVLFVGRLERRKGVDTLLAAARELVDDGVEVTFTLAGQNADNSFRDSFDREAATRPRLRAAAHFTGMVSDAELHRLYVDADIVCVPSRYESHGVVLIEAMMFGKPLVTCAAGGISEVVRAGHDAIVVPPEDPTALAESLRRLLANPELRAQLGAAARQSYERRFEAQSVARRMESFLEEVITAHRNAPVDSPDVRERLQRFLGKVLSLGPDDASTLAGELLQPPAAAFRVRRTQESARQASSA